MNRGLNKILGIMLVVGMILSSMTMIATNVGSGEVEEEIEIENLNPDSSKDEYIHLVWQENVSNYQIFYTNDKTENFKIQLKSAIKEIQIIRDKDTKAEKSMEKIDEALNFTLTQEYEESFESVKQAIQNLQQSSAETEEIVNVLYSSVKDFSKCNLLYSQSLVEFNNSHVQKSWQHYYKAIEFMNNDDSNEEKYEDAIERFKQAYKGSLKAKGEWVPESYVENVQEALNGIQILMDSTTGKKALKELEKSKDELNKALEKVNSSENDRLEKSFDNIKKAIGHLEKAEKEGVSTIEIRCWLMITVKDVIDTIVKSQSLVKNTYFEKAKEEYDNALEYMRDYEFDNALQYFKTVIQHIKKAITGVEFGNIVMVSSTSYDSVSPKIYLNGEISVGWIEKTPDEDHVLYARSEDGISWWYLDANEYASTYLCYAGIDPSLVNIENMLTITRTLERIWIIDRCHYFYAPIIKDGFTIEDRRVYAPINDPYLTIYDGNYEPILIGDKKFYIICGGPHPLPPPKAPDLTITDITYSPSYPVIGQTTTLIINVENIGDASASNIEVAVYDGDTLLRCNTIECLDPCLSTQISIPYTFSSIGTHTITAIADPNNNINEGDESNNRMTKNINVAVASLPLSAAAGDVTTMSSDNFDDGNTNGWTLSGLWHVTSYRKYSGSYSLAYNQESSHNYNTGSRTYGSAEFSVDLSGVSTSTLTFQTWWEHESYSSGSYDSMDVDIYDSSWHNLWHRDCNEGPSSSDWHQESIDISTYAGGTVKIRFNFDSIDSLYNNYEGWYIDDVNVATGETTVEITAGTGGGIWGSDTWDPRDPYNTYYHDNRAQTVILASELISAGLSAEPITAMQLRCYQLPGNSDLKDFRIRMKHTTATTSTAWVTSGWTLVYGPTSIPKSSLSAGAWYTYIFHTSFNWDGTSNLLIDISRDDTYYTSGGGMYVRTGLSSRTVAGCGDSDYTWPFDSMSGGVLNHIPEMKITGSGCVTNQPPTASFTYSPSSPTVDDTIQFTDQSTDSDGYIASRSWNFGDGSTSTSQNPTHKYSSAGTYTVTLTVVDEDGGAASHSKTIFVCGVTYFRWYWSIDSPHNYPNYYDKTWTITQPGVNIKLITFSKIDLENGYDYLYVYDKNNNLLYSLTGSVVGISYSINVNTDTIKLRLYTDYSITKWGFQLECIVWTVSATESSHPYSNNYDNTWTITKSNANKIRIHFTSDTEVENNYDFLYLYDGSGNQIWKKTGVLGEFWTDWVNGDTVKVRLTTDGSVTKYGFYVDFVDCKLGDDDDKTEVSILGVGNYADDTEHDLDNGDADITYNYFVDEGWCVNYNLRDASVDDHHFYSEGDNVDLIYFTGHGGEYLLEQGFVCLDGYWCWWASPSDSYWFLNDEHSVGSNDWEWALFMACDVMGGYESRQMLYHGGHSIFGFDDVSYDTPADDDITTSFHTYAFQYDYQIEWAFVYACHNNDQYNVSSFMHDHNDDDHLWGHGRVYSDCSDNSDISWWSYD